MILASDGPTDRSSSQRLRVGVLLSGFDSWGGGLDFVRIILNGLLVQGDIDVRLLIPQPTGWNRLRSFAGACRRLVLSGIAGRPRWQYTIGFGRTAVLAAFADFSGRVTITSFPNHRRGLQRALREVAVDVVVPSISSLGADFPVPWVGYIFDFQHQHLPQFFSAKERAARDQSFALMLKEAPVVIVNAKKVRDDAHQFFPDAAGKVVCLPFAPSPRPEWLDLDAESARRQYSVPDRYFIVCNQFWLHKDHGTAIRAFAEFVAARHDRDVALVCTGQLHDYRDPGHIDRIRALAEQLGVRDRVLLLGHIPKRHQIALLRGALATLQPTLYEGGPGGGAVYDAVALGVPALVSDIPVNREVEDGECRFFPPGDASALARLMSDLVIHPPARTDRQELLEQASNRLLKLREALQQAIAMSRSSGGSRSTSR